MTPIHVVGPGALGGLVAARLAGAGEVVVFVGPKEDGPKDELRLVDGDASPLAFEVSRLGPASLREGGDLERVVVCVKAHQLESALRTIADRVTEATEILLLGNGLGLVEVARRILPDGCIECGVTTYGALREEAPRGALHIRATGVGHVDLQDRSPWISRFENAGLTVRIHSPVDLSIAVWTKAIVNCSLNSLAAVLGFRNGDLVESGVFGLVPEIAREAVEVALVRLGADAPIARERWSVGTWSERVESVARGTAENRCSMLVDLDRGRRTEIDYLNGRIADWGRAAGIATPMNHLLTELIRAREERGGIVEGL